MADIVDRATRSRMMSAIKGRDTTPERTVRSWLHRSGLRFRLNVPRLPGSPDIVLPRYSTVIFVHGCFWHRHQGCRFSTIPKSNREFWKAKFRKNSARDRRVANALADAGWRVEVVWTCQLSERRISALATRIRGRRRERET